MKCSTALFQTTIAATALASETSAFVPAASMASAAALHNSSDDINAAAASQASASISASETTTETTTAKKKNPIDVFGIDHVVLLVDDLAGMSEWYQTVLGCRVAKIQDKFKMVHLDAGSALIDLVDRSGPLGNGNGDADGDPQTTTQKLGHICLGLRDFDEAAIRAHLEEHGVDITTDIGTRFGKAGYGESLYFRDPEGTEIEIRKSLLL